MQKEAGKRGGLPSPCSLQCEGSPRLFPTSYPSLSELCYTESETFKLKLSRSVKAELAGLQRVQGSSQGTKVQREGDGMRVEKWAKEITDLISVNPIFCDIWVSSR